MSTFTPTRPLESPVLFIVFNRPDTTRIVFQAIRAARPPRLYVAADGPRGDVEDDARKCLEVRRTFDQVDWPCAVHFLYREKNLGCGVALSSALTWFFSAEPEGIVLEDDCLPSQSFFWYCQELLERYRHDTRIMHIGGNNFLNGWRRSQRYSYYFSRNGHIWGWATWRRAWQYYDLYLSLFPELKAAGFFDHFFLNPLEKFYRLRKFDRISRGHIDTWDYQWDFARYIHSGFAVVPQKNLVRNLGFGAGATHTTGGGPYSKLEAEEVEFPLRHPDHVLRNVDCDRRYFSDLIKNSLKAKLGI